MSNRRILQTLVDFKLFIMFNHPFSFKGRIRRTEYGLSCIIFIVIYSCSRILVLVSGDTTSLIMFVLIGIAINWFLFAQGAKRCHDVGVSGWFQLIPFFGLYLLFADGEMRRNKYGDNPKKQVFSDETVHENIP